MKKALVASEKDPRFQVRKSRIPGAGLGLFAKVRLKKGALLEVSGVLIARNSAADRCTRYADPYKFRVGRRLLIPTGYGGMVNHSRAPNMEKVFRKDGVQLRTLRTISPGEELFFTYTGYARKRFGLG